MIVELQNGNKGQSDEPATPESLCSCYGTDVPLGDLNHIKEWVKLKDSHLPNAQQ